ncbi:hypothetical protein ALC62_11925 [Cyphomyrmex costatus]|uniref:Uncharacterized protein n=1 Tax=Cyphomyrmex costatus TaxID=456900 RepID=A0A195CAB4_9HYME|nr:hypothetical protein ALC62_11925 [Cyphomyrmex costatus]
MVGNSGCAAFCVLRNELKFDQNFPFSSADGIQRSSLTRIIFGTFGTILFQNEIQFCIGCHASLTTKLQRPYLPMIKDPVGLEPWMMYRNSSASRGKRRGSLLLSALSDIFFPPSIGLHYTLPGVFQRSLKPSKMQQANSTNKPGESCSTSTLVASTRVVSYMEKHAT